MSTNDSFFLFNGEIMYCPFPVRYPRGGGTLQAPLCPAPKPTYPKKMWSAPRKIQRKSQRKETNETAHPSPSVAMTSGVGRKSGVSPARGSSILAPCSSDTSLTASSSAGTRLPTSVEVRKST